jgi:hypothetical protein
MQLINKLKDKVMQLGCRVVTFAMNLIKKFDWAKTYAFLIKHKKRIIIILIVLFAANYAYDKWMPKSAKKVPPQLVTTTVVETADTPSKQPAPSWLPILLIFVRKQPMW